MTIQATWNPCDIKILTNLVISFKRCYIRNIEQIQGEDDVNHRLEKIRESVKKLSTSERYNLAMVSNRSYLPSSTL